MGMTETVQRKRPTARARRPDQDQPRSRRTQPSMIALGGHHEHGTTRAWPRSHGWPGWERCEERERERRKVEGRGEVEGIYFPYLVSQTETVKPKPGPPILPRSTTAHLQHLDAYSQDRTHLHTHPTPEPVRISQRNRAMEKRQTISNGEEQRELKSLIK